MLNITNRQENANQNHNEISPGIAGGFFTTEPSGKCSSGSPGQKGPVEERIIGVATNRHTDEFWSDGYKGWFYLLDCVSIILMIADF